jgi:hypothetical protein
MARSTASPTLNAQRGTQTAQERGAYCALRGWAASAGYAPLTITPAQDAANPANLEPVRCP